jgi:hypothetical protein
VGVAAGMRAVQVNGYELVSEQAFQAGPERGKDFFQLF